jgi:hypothetical protein
VSGAGGVTAREVLLADEANLLNIFRAGEGRRPNAHVRSAWGVRLDHVCQKPSASVRLAKRACFDGSSRRGDDVKSAGQKAEEQREAKLELILESGSLVIAKMTPEVRRRYSHRPASPKRPGRR